MMRTPPRITAAVGLLIVCSLLASACVDEPPPAGPPELDRGAFGATVYPVLLRDCGFPACHGDTNRFFQLHGPNRTRLDPSTPLDEPPTRAEIDAAYERARSMLASAPSAEESLLLRKPLEVDLGGAPHMGIDDNGRDVYGSREAAGYQALLAWATDSEPVAPMPEVEPGPDAGDDTDADIVEADAGVSEDAGGEP
jgi:hypothetical protein